jgi:hypothetical protein
MDKTLELTEIYKSTIENALGLIVSIDDDGDLRFKHPDLGIFYIAIDAVNDPEFMMLTYPAFIDAKRGLDKNQLSYVCNKINSRCKGIKLVIANNDDSDVHAILQMLVAMPGEFPSKEFLTAVLNRSFSMIINAIANFATDVQLLLAKPLKADVQIQLQLH